MGKDIKFSIKIYIFLLYITLLTTVEAPALSTTKLYMFSVLSAK